MKKIICILLSLLLTIVCMPTAMTAENTIIIDSVVIEESGFCEVIGHLSNNAEDAQVTIIARTADAVENSEDVTIENTIYIDQVTTGNNGTFLMEFKVGIRFSEADAVFIFGSDENTGSVQYACSIPELTAEFESIENNSVLYGNDIYGINSTYLNAEYVVQSIIQGGNIIYFKIGDAWYDLLNKDATSSEYLIPENAAENETVKEFATGMYYQGSIRIKLKGADE